MIRAPLERVDERGRPQRRAGERAEDGKHLRVERVEAMRLERIGGQRADDLAAIGQRAAEAGVHAVVRVQRADDVAVERVGKLASRAETAPGSLLRRMTSRRGCSRRS